MTTAAQYPVVPYVPGTKKPAVEDWTKILPGQFPAIGDHGRVLDPATLVLDIDFRNMPVGLNDPTGDNIFSELAKKYPLPATKIVRTPSGGYHLYFRKNPALKLRRKQSLFPGIDFLSEGAQCGQPGTRLADGSVYLSISDTEPAELPAALLSVLEQRAEADETFAEESLTHYEQYKAECESSLPAIQGQHGDDTTYHLACRGRDLALPKDAVFQLMRDYWNPRCLPAWDDSELYQKVCHAYAYAKNAPGSATPEAKFLALHQKDNVIKIETYQNEIAWQGVIAEAYELDKKGNPINSPANVALVLRTDAAWRGRLKYNQFANKIEYSGRPPWRTEQLNQGTGLSEYDYSQLRIWFSSVKRWSVAKDVLRDAAYAASLPYHPVKEYLDGLVWDGLPRLDRILVDTAGAEDSPYTREVGRCLMLSAVKRIYEPGCKHDYVPVLEGNQGTGKSTWVAVLGGEWYSANDLVRGDKDTWQNLRGRWFVELPEINATFNKADFAWLKGVISCSNDIYRKSYGHDSDSVPRESVFIGSINPGASKQYLRDDENRRYWPVQTGQFDLEKLRQYRDQYFAEAVHRYQAGEPNWIVDETVTAVAAMIQESRREENPLTEILTDWVAIHKEGFSTAAAYLQLGINPGSVTRTQRAYVYSALQALGYEFNRATNIWQKKVLTWGDLI